MPKEKENIRQTVEEIQSVLVPSGYSRSNSTLSPITKMIGEFYNSSNMRNRLDYVRTIIESTRGGELENNITTDKFKALSVEKKKVLKEIVNNSINIYKTGTNFAAIKELMTTDYIRALYNENGLPTNTDGYLNGAENELSGFSSDSAMRILSVLKMTGDMDSLRKGFENDIQKDILDLLTFLKYNNADIFVIVNYMYQLINLFFDRDDLFQDLMERVDIDVINRTPIKKVEVSDVDIEDEYDESKLTRDDYNKIADRVYDFLTSNLSEDYLDYDVVDVILEHAGTRDLLDLKSLMDGSFNIRNIDTFKSIVTIFVSRFDKSFYPINDISVILMLLYLAYIAKHNAEKESNPELATIKVYNMFNAKKIPVDGKIELNLVNAIGFDLTVEDKFATWVLARTTNGNKGSELLMFADKFLSPGPHGQRLNPDNITRTGVDITKTDIANFFAKEKFRLNDENLMADLQTAILTVLR